jgi:predicted MFS family arabinose efflux permease
MVTGIFGGVIGSIVLAITTDLFPYSMRGRVMGVIQTSFAASQILGIPIGVFLSNHWGWHAAFLMIVAVAAVAGILIWRYLRPIDGHLKLKTDRSAIHHLIQTISTPRYLQAFATTALLTTGGFMLMPFGSAFSVHNLGLRMEDLPLLYGISGVCAIFTGPLVGRASDRFGKFNLFVFGSLLTIVMVIVYTRLEITPMWLVVAISALMFVGISSRMIPSQALMSAIPEASSRGAFMSVSSSLQQVSGGLASVLAGYIILEGPGGRLEHFDRLGDVIVAAVVITLVLMYFIQRRVAEKIATATPTP